MPLHERISKSRHAKDSDFFICHVYRFGFFSHSVESPSKTICAYQCCERGGNEKRTYGEIGTLSETHQLGDTLGAKIIVQHEKCMTRDEVYCLLQSHEKQRDLEGARQVQYLLANNGFESITVLGDHLIRLFAHCQRLFEANKSFNKIAEPNAFTWAAIISANANLDQGDEAIELYHKMQSSGTESDRYIYVAVLKACSITSKLLQGRFIHHQIIERGLQSDIVLSNTLIHMYAKCGNFGGALNVFENLSNPNVVSWNAMITGYAIERQPLLALECFEKMQKSGIQPNIVSWGAVIAGCAQHDEASIALECFAQMIRLGIKPDKEVYFSTLKACASLGEVEQGRLLHKKIINDNFQSDVVLSNTLIDMYVKGGSIQEAYEVFDSLSEKNVVSWDAMIAGHLQHGQFFVALECLGRMHQEGMEPNNFVFLSILKACAYIGEVSHGRLIHNWVIISGFHKDVFIGSTLIDMYAKCGSLDEAARVFSSLPYRNVVSWGAMISGYVQHGEILLSSVCFMEMQQAGIEPNVVCWNAVIAGYSQHGDCLVALDCFLNMQYEGVEPTGITFLSLLNACASLTTVEQGRLIHEQFIRSKVECTIDLGNALLDMYSKCGNLDEARKVFDKMPSRDVVSWNEMVVGYLQSSNSLVVALECFDTMQHEGIKPDVVTWNTMIAGYVSHGEGLLALDCFAKMQHENIEPTKATFLVALSACATIGAIDQGRCIHDKIAKMNKQLDITSGNSVLDMYAKCGSLSEACIVFENLPMQDKVSWNAMIAGYAQHGKCSLVLHCFENMQQADIIPDGLSFTSILIVCSRAGLVEEGRWYFKSMIEDYGIMPLALHCTCIIDLLGRAGNLTEAEHLLQATDETNISGWNALLSSCNMHGNVQVGRRCFKEIVYLNTHSAAGYVLMSNIFAYARKDRL